ncbi:MAG: YaaA family protein [Campylobacterota bacterium]
MKILLAPAESKRQGGDKKPYCKENFAFDELSDIRDKAFNAYEQFIQSQSIEELSKWFGLKKDSEVVKYKQSLKDKPTMKAIQRYTGVAFDAISYDDLKKQEQNYIDENVVIFSNLFGPLKADDNIPDYKYKQGAKLPNLNIEKFYKDSTTNYLDEYVEGEIIDLRAGYYEKFYKSSKADILTFKFIKNGKVVSHWAKHYRGEVLKQMSQKNIISIKDFMNTSIDGLKLIEIQEKKNIKQLILEIENY